MPGEKQTKAPRSERTSILNKHHNISQFRLDTWNRLKNGARRLEERHKNNGNVSLPLKLVSELLSMLEPIERYWAFPGKELFRQLQGLFERQEYHLLAGAVNYVVRLLASESYRQRAAQVPLLDLSKLLSSGQSAGGDERRGLGVDQHYYEVLVVDDLSAAEERELRQRMLSMADAEDRFAYDIVVVPSFEDALIATMLNFNIQSCVIRYHFPFESRNELEFLHQYVADLEEVYREERRESEPALALGRLLKKIRPELDLYLVTDLGVEEIGTHSYGDFRRIFYRQEDYLELHLSIRRGIMERYDTPFFTALKEYSRRPTGVFHAMPVSRGNSVFKSHWIRDMGEFYGRNIFLAETSATTGGLDSLLQPRGPLKKAQEMAARAFGSQHTFFVTNGTSTSNKVVLQALVQPGDIVLVDRDCHKSHHYGLLLSGAYPIYLDSYPVEQYSMYGAVPLHEIKRTLLELKRVGALERVKMLLLTNCTFDGLVYHVERVMEEVLAIKPDIVFLWDEAWFGFAYFAPTYRRRTAMHNAAALYARFRSRTYRDEYKAFRERFDKLDPQDDATWLKERLLPDPDRVKVRAYATQSTHKKLSALRQSGMIHVWDEEFNRKAEVTFHEAYMTHTSTSPNYQILASLDLARRQVEFEGFELVNKSVEMAMTLRARVTDHPLLRKYFDVLTLKDLVPLAHRVSGVEQYYDPQRGWSDMEKAWRQDEFVLDPTHITLYIGRTGIDGDTFKNRYLMDQFGIQVNKTSRNTVLFMTNIGTTRSSVAYLVGVLLKIAHQLERQQLSFDPTDQRHYQERVHSLTMDLPPLPHFSYFHPAFRPVAGTVAGDSRAAFFMAYDEAMCEYLPLDGSVEAALEGGREVVSASFVIPYPPGFPILVPGQVISREILDFMKALDVKEIHGYEPEMGLRVFTEAAMRERLVKSGAGRESNGGEQVRPALAKPSRKKEKAPAGA